MPLAEGQPDVPWPCNPDNKYIVHFPETREIWSYGSGYGGNALLGKKCFALRIASAMARDEGWMAEHMLILKLTSPEGEVKYVTGAFPSACGKTNLAMLIPTLEGWTVETVGDDIAWMKFDDDGRLCAVNPEAGFFGVAPNTSHKTNPNAMDTIERNSIFTNCALTDDGDIWWEGMTGEPPDARDRLEGQRLDARVDRAGRPPERPLHDAGRAMPVDRPGVGGPRRRADRRLPLRRPPGDASCRWSASPSTGTTASSSARRWSSETTAAAAGEVGKLRFDPMAMLPFCGYNMADYFEHWLDDRRGNPDRMPRIFVVNWFRKDDDGKFLWPGFGENSRVLEWVFRRCNGEGETVETPIGLVPAPRASSTSTASTSPTRRCASCSPSTPKVAGPAAAGRGVPRPVRRPAPGRDRRPARGAEAAPGLAIAYLR